MILVFNKLCYEYDIRGLITSFFPGMIVETRVVEDDISDGTAVETSVQNRNFGEEYVPDGKSRAIELLYQARTYGLSAWKNRADIASEKIVEMGLPAEVSEALEKAGVSEKTAVSENAAASEKMAVSENAAASEKAARPEDLEAQSDEPGEIIFAVYYHEHFTALCASDGKQGYCSAAFDDSEGGMDKNPLKRMTYGIFSRMTGGKLHPWGTLTGIRPVKLPMALLEKGFSDEEVAARLKREYLIGEEKCGLSIRIAHKERALLDLLDYEDGYSLYVGIPFCPTNCLYCSFTSYPYSRWEKRIGEYVEALEKEIRFVQTHFAGKKFNTIYFGGGTPTTLPPVYLDRILGKIVDSFDLSHLKEWTVEGGRPDSITPEKLAVLRRYPVDRISINPQTMKQETLDLIGRRHTVEQVKEAFYMAREAGFDNINMDLIIGLPQEHEEDVLHTMEEITALNPDNLTVHTLAIKRASRLNMDREQYGHLYLEQNTIAMMDIAAKGAAQMGMEPYYLYRQKNMSGNLENVGYARPGKEGIYNILIMEEKQSIIACGAGSTSKRVYLDGRIERCENVKDVASYMERIDEMIERKRKLFADI